jgi:uncharacterized DUF497 family protein
VTAAKTSVHLQVDALAWSVVDRFAARQAVQSWLTVVCANVQPHIMHRAIAGFDWDEGNRGKCQKHGVSIDEIEALLSGEPRVAPDLRHSVDEDRFIAVGGSAQGRPLFVAFTFRTKDGQRLIRPVSARYMRSEEIERYETEGS